MSVKYAELSQLPNGLQDKVLDSENDKVKAGWIGIVFGVGENTGRNIAGVVIVGALLAGVFMSGLPVWRDKPADYECWKVLSPMIMGALGYLFGQVGCVSKGERK